MARPKKRTLRKLSLYMPDDLLAEVRTQSERLDRPISFVLEMAWKLAKVRLKERRAPAVTAQADAPGRPAAALP